MDILNLFGFIENLALYFPKTKTIAISFLSLSLSAVDRGELFCSCKRTFILLKIQRGLLHLIGLLQLTITWYKIHHAGGEAHYYSPTGTLKQRQVKLDWFMSLCFNVPVGE